jgi:hypothetical protein
LAVASIRAVVSPVFITAKMEALRAEGMAGGSEFKKLHGRSMMVYVGDAAVLALAGVLMPSPQFRRK